MSKLLILTLLFNFALFSQNNDLYNKFLLANNYEQTNQLEKAKNIYEQIVREAPQNEQFFDGLIRVYLQLKNYNESVSLVENRIKNSPDNVNLYGLLGKIYYIQGDEKKAYSVWDDALNHIDNEFGYRIIANYAIDRRAFKKAIDVLEKAQNKSKEPVSYSSELANLYQLTMQYDKAINQYSILVSTNPNTLSQVQSRLQPLLSKPEVVNELIKSLENTSNNNMKYLLAWIYEEDKKWDKAFGLYREIDKTKNGDLLFAFGENAFQEKEYKIALNVFEYLYNKYSGSKNIANIKYAYARTLEEEFYSAPLNPVDNWKPVYVYIFTRNEIFDKVTGLYSEIASAYKGSNASFNSFYRIGILYESILDYSEAEKYLNNAVQDNKSSSYADALEELGDIQLLKDNLDKAEQFYNSITGNKNIDNSKKNAALFKLAKLNFYKGNFEKAKSISLQLSQDLNDNTANDALEMSLLLDNKVNDSLSLLKFAKAELFATQNKYEKAFNIYKEINESQKGLVLPNLALYKSAEMLVALNKYDLAVELLEKESEKVKANIFGDKALYLLGKIYQYGMKNDVKAMEVYEKIFVDFPDSIYLDEIRKEILNLQNKMS